MLKALKAFFPEELPTQSNIYYLIRSFLKKKKKKNMFDYMQNMPFYFEM